MQAWPSPAPVRRSVVLEERIRLTYICSTRQLSCAISSQCLRTSQFRPISLRLPADCSPKSGLGVVDAEMHNCAAQRTTRTHMLSIVTTRLSISASPSFRLAVHLRTAAPTSIHQRACAVVRLNGHASAYTEPCRAGQLFGYSSSPPVQAAPSGSQRPRAQIKCELYLTLPHTTALAEYVAFHVTIALTTCSATSVHCDSQLDPHIGDPRFDVHVPHVVHHLHGTTASHR